MNFNPQKHHRRSIRLQNYDYTKSGAYFVTLNTYQREKLFGEIVNDEMMFSECGRVVEEEWLRTAEVRKNVELDAYVVMPNHFHAIIVLSNDAVGASRRLAPCRQGLSVPSWRSSNPSLPNASTRCVPYRPPPFGNGIITNTSSAMKVISYVFVITLRRTLCGGQKMKINYNFNCVVACAVSSTQTPPPPTHVLHSLNRSRRTWECERLAGSVLTVRAGCRDAHCRRQRCNVRGVVC